MARSSAKRLVRRVLAASAVCMIAAAIPPAALGADRLSHANRSRAWASTAVPQATLEVAGKGYRVSALSSDGRVAVVADSRGIYLFRVPSDGSWGSSPKPSARLRVPESALANLAAVATSCNGATVLVAAGAVGNAKAAVYVFHVKSPRAWKSQLSPTARLTDTAEPTSFGSGVALSCDGTTALVGEQGGASVFHVASADSWRDSSTPTARLVADTASAEEGGLGIAVALSADGTTALIGATSLYTFVGAAYIFHAPAADAWVSSATPDAVLTDGFVGLSGDGFGGAVSLSPDGTIALVGAPNIAFGPAGAAYFFHARAADAWATTSAPDAVVGPTSVKHGGDGDVPGWSVALSAEGTALVGDPSTLGGPGAADLYHLAGREQPGSFRTVSHAKLTNAASPPRDLFGAAVGASSDGTTVLVSSARTSFIYTQTASREATHCYVPYLHGMAVPAAKRAIESTLCRVGKVTGINTPLGQNDRVISQTPKPGKRLAKGAKIDLGVNSVQNH